MRSTVWFWGGSLCWSERRRPARTDAKSDVGPADPGRTGRWSLGFKNGEELPADQVKTAELTIDDDQYRATLGALPMAATIKVDSSRAPREISTLRLPKEDQKGMTVKGIYKVAGEDLTICRSLTERSHRPVEFAAPTSSGLLTDDPGNGPETVVSDKGKASRKSWKRSRRPGGSSAVEIEAEGQQVPEKVFEKDTLVLRGDQFTSYVAGKVVHGLFKIDPLAMPKTIDIIFTEGPGKGHGSQRGIYRARRRHSRRFALPCQTGPARPNSRASPKADTYWRS